VRGTAKDVVSNEAEGNKMKGKETHLLFQKRRPVLRLPLHLLKPLALPLSLLHLLSQFPLLSVEVFSLPGEVGEGRSVGGVGGLEVGEGGGEAGEGGGKGRYRGGLWNCGGGEGLMLEKDDRKREKGKNVLGAARYGFLPSFPFFPSSLFTLSPPALLICAASHSRCSSSSSSTSIPTSSIISPISCRIFSAAALLAFLPRGREVRESV
jgi:hypothetical protein